MKVEYEHFKERLKERYGFNITKREYDTLCSKPWITAIFGIERMKNDTQLVVQFKWDKHVDTPIYAVYSFNRKVFTTAIPKPQHWSLCDL